MSGAPAEQRKTATPWSGPQGWLLLGLTFLAFCLRVFQLGRESLWFDEILSATFAELPVQAAIRAMLQEGLHHSPLFYLLLRPFGTTPQTEFSLRFAALAFGVVAIPLIAQFGRLLGSRRVGLLAALLLAVNPFHIWYSRETRMYSLLFLAALGAFWFFSRNILRHPQLSNWLGLALCTAVAVNTHHFAYYIPLVQFIFLIATLKSNYPLLRAWVAVMLAVGLSLIPWVLIVSNWGKFYWASAANGIQPVLADLFNTLWNFSLGYTEHLTLFVIAALGVFVLVLWAGTRRPGQTTLLLVLWLLVPVLLTFVVSFRFPMYLDRYLIVALPAFLLLLAAGIANVPTAALRLAASGVVVAAMVVGLAQIYVNRNIYERADWRQAGAYLDRVVDAQHDTVATLYYQELMPLGFYCHTPAPRHPVISFDVFDLPELPAAGGEAGTLYFVIGHPNYSAHLVGHCQAFDIDKLTSSQQVKEWRTQNQNRLVGIEEFTCIRIEAYE